MPSALYAPMNGLRYSSCMGVGKFVPEPFNTVPFLYNKNFLVELSKSKAKPYTSPAPTVNPLAQPVDSLLVCEPPVQ